VHILAVLSMKNRALIALVTIVAAVFGGIALTSLKQELAPSVEFPQLAIVTTYPGAAPAVVEEDVSTPIETAVQGVAGVESTTATSSTNLSLVSVTFAYGTDLASAEQKVTLAINRLSSELPEDVDPQTLTGGIDDFPVIQIAATGGGTTDELSAAINTSVLSDIRELDGVRDASLSGETGKRVTIVPDQAELLAAGLAQTDITDALDQNGVLIPAGEITEGGRTLAVQAGSRLSTVEDVSGIPLVGQTTAGEPLTIGDVATVELTDDPVTSISRVDGEPALTIAVTKLPDANTVDVSNAVRALIPDLEETLGTDATLTIVFDQAPYIQQSIEALATEGLLGLGFAVIVILVFLLSVRATLVTAISIPTSVLITFIGMQATGYTLNIITLGGLTIAIGRVVDDSIVVIENIKRHLAIVGRESGADGRAAAILRGVREVAGAITASTITTVAVFLPLAFVGDISGELFRPFALTVTIALLASLLVSLTIVPVLAYWFLRAPKPKTEKAVTAASEASTTTTATTTTTAAEAVGPTPGLADAPSDEHHGARELPATGPSPEPGRSDDPADFEPVDAIAAAPEPAPESAKAHDEHDRAGAAASLPAGVAAAPAIVEPRWIVGSTPAPEQATDGSAEPTAEPTAEPAAEAAPVSAPEAAAAPEPVAVVDESAPEAEAADTGSHSYSHSPSPLPSPSSAGARPDREPVLTNTAAPVSRRARRGESIADDDVERPTLLQRGYLPIIRWTLKHSAITLVLALLVLVGTGFAVPFMKTNFLGSAGQNTFSVTQTLPVGTSLAELDTASQDVEQVLVDTEGVETVQLSMGSSGSGIQALFGGGGEGTITYSITTDEDADQDALQADVRDELDAIDGVGEISVQVSSGFGGSSDIEVDVTAPNQDALLTATEEIADAVRELDVVSEVTDNLSETRPYIAVSVDRQDAAAAGYSEVALGAIVSGAMQPQTVGSIVIDETTLSIYIASDDPPTTRDELAALEVPTATGVVALDTLATVEEVDGPASITTVSGLRSSTVSVTPSSDDVGTASAEVQQAVDAADLEGGASASLGGVASDQSSAFTQLGLALLAAILIVYIVMVATFRSLRQPLLLLVSVPFAATGAIGLQVITGVPLGVPSLIGVLMLIGIVVTNAIVLVDLVNQYRRRGMTVPDAVEHGSIRRLRPILMTALATIFALVPMALGITGHGGFISQPLAIVVIGGLVSSTLLTLIVLPSLYNLVEGARDRRAARRAARAARTA
jgi:multidrug efflux pump subunit AcrB